ncbi:MAG: stage III sporulation protein AA, partial [Syntrophaceticus sp.]
MAQVAVRGLEEILPFITPSIREILGLMPCSILDDLEEVRLRLNRPLAVRLNQDEFFLNHKGEISPLISGAYIVSREDIQKTVQLISQGSLYAFEEEFRQGFLTLPGGHRVGLAGRAVLEGGSLKRIKEISSLNFRIARAVP